MTKSSKVEFGCQAAEAAEVFLAGTFNGWNPSVTPMQRHADGSWHAALALPPGYYEFKFVVDGDWCCEPGSGDPPDCVPNQFGTMNRVAHVR